MVGATRLTVIQEALNLPGDHVALGAWAEAYGVLANVFINAEANIYSNNKKTRVVGKAIEIFI